MSYSTPKGYKTVGLSESPGSAQRTSCWEGPGFLLQHSIEREHLTLEDVLGLPRLWGWAGGGGGPRSTKGKVLGMIG